MNKELNQAYEITVEQAKLLGSSQRVKIISMLVDKAKTAKQVADELGDSPRSIHNHIQKLYEGELIDLVETKTFGGIVEKYYKSKAKWFNTRGTQLVEPILADDYNPVTSTKLNLRMQLSSEQLEEMTMDFKALLEKWVILSTKFQGKNSHEYAIGIKMNSVESINSID